MRTEKQKMLSGELYDASDEELCRERARCRELCKSLNATIGGQGEVAQALLGDLFAKSVDPWVEVPFFCDYGTNIELGEKVFFNFNCVVLDVAKVVIGDHVLFGPAVQVYTATHPIDAVERREGLESGEAVTIGSDVWIGGGAIICPGVTIGDRSVIGAGSVVTRDVPSDVIVAGNPARVIREIGSVE